MCGNCNSNRNLLTMNRTIDSIFLVKICNRMEIVLARFQFVLFFYSYTHTQIAIDAIFLLRLFCFALFMYDSNLSLRLCV